MEKAKSKKQNNNLKRKINIYSLFAFLFVIFNFTFLFSISSDIFAASRYHIKELGNCKNAQECFLYCQIPRNTPACWSYDKYILSNNVLGESTVNISYPVPELNNCASAKECFTYCSQEENRDACKKYGEEKGLIKNQKKTINGEILEYARNELGCTDRESCKTFCANPANNTACRSFALKHSLRSAAPTPAEDIINNAKNELKCSNYTQCVSFCEIEDNREKCLKFAKDHNLISSDTLEREKILKEKMQDLLETAKEDLDCDSFALCAKKCQDPSNKEKCENIAQEYSLAPAGIRKQFTDPNTNNSASPVPSQKHDSGNGKRPCTNEKECQEYCKINPKECPGYSLLPTVKPGTASPTPKAGEYLGPGGCKTETECRAYCTAHPNECPGFPKPTLTYAPSPTIKPSPTVIKPSNTPIPTQTVLRTQSSSTNIAATPTPEFPADCNQSAECIARYCLKYPTHCPNQFPTAKPAGSNTFIEVTVPPSSTSFGILNNTPIPVPDIN